MSLYMIDFETILRGEQLLPFASFDSKVGTSTFLNLEPSLFTLTSLISPQKQDQSSLFIINANIYNQKHLQQQFQAYMVWL